MLKKQTGDHVDVLKVKRVLVSVFDKTGVVDFVKGLGNVEVISTGGTAKALRQGGIEVVDVSEVTGHPEILHGRVKTLHPRIHGALLHVKGNKEQDAEMEQLNILPIDMVVVNLYPFAQTVGSGADLDTCIESVDVGGPCMLHAAAKNFKYVVPVSSPKQYPVVLKQIEECGGVKRLTRQTLAMSAFRLTGSYYTLVSRTIDPNK